jgi:hypothetical protein
MNSLSYSIFYDFVIKQLNNYYLFNEGIELWQIYNKFWIQFYFDFFNGYSEWAKWLFDVNISTLNDVFGLVNMVQDVGGCNRKYKERKYILQLQLAKSG